MKKSDLKTGMLCQYRNGAVGMIINDCFIQKKAFANYSNFNDDLTHMYNNKFDIIRVSSVVTDGELMHEYWDERTLGCYLLWERKPEKVIEFDGVEYSESTLRSIIKKATE